MPETSNVYRKILPDSMFDPSRGRIFLANVYSINM
jgi:hypothetical protein